MLSNSASSLILLCSIRLATQDTLRLRLWLPRYDKQRPLLSAEHGDGTSAVATAVVPASSDVSTVLQLAASCQRFRRRCQCAAAFVQHRTVQRQLTCRRAWGMQTADYHQMISARLAGFGAACTRASHQAAEAKRDRQGKTKPVHTQCSAL